MSAAADMVRVYFPTIMSGAVLRWYDSPEAFRSGREVASVSTYGIHLREAGRDLAREAADVFDAMTAGDPHEVAKALATHRTIGLFDRTLHEVTR